MGRWQKRVPIWGRERVPIFGAIDFIGGWPGLHRTQFARSTAPARERKGLTDREHHARDSRRRRRIVALCWPRGGAPPSIIIPFFRHSSYSRWAGPSLLLPRSRDALD